MVSNPPPVTAMGSASVMLATPTTMVTANPTAPQATVSCQPAVSAVPRNGRVVLRGQNLNAVTSVSIGGQAAPIVRATSTELNVQLSGNGGAVQIEAGGRTQACGNIRVMGP